MKRSTVVALAIGIGLHCCVAFARYIQGDPAGIVLNPTHQAITASDVLKRNQVNHLYAYANNSPLKYVDPMGLCAASPDMLKCLRQVFGQDVDWVNVVIDPPMIYRHFGPGVRGATTRPGIVYINMSCDDFWDDPTLVLHEYYHVVRQWAVGMTVPGYLMQFWIKEREARDFAAQNVGRLRNCLTCSAKQ